MRCVARGDTWEPLFPPSFAYTPPPLPTFQKKFPQSTSRQSLICIYNKLGCRTRFWLPDRSAVCDDVSWRRKRRDVTRSPTRGSRTAALVAPSLPHSLFSPQSSLLLLLPTFILPSFLHHHHHPPFHSIRWAPPVFQTPPALFSLFPPFIHSASLPTFLSQGGVGGNIKSHHPPPPTNSTRPFFPLYASPPPPRRLFPTQFRHSTALSINLTQLNLNTTAFNTLKFSMKTITYLHRHSIPSLTITHRC